MFYTWFQSLQDFNIVTIFLVCILGISLFQGWRRGASNSAGRLFTLLCGVILTLLGLAISVPFTIWLSSRLQLWLVDYATKLPNRDLNGWEQAYYTFMTSMADFPLMRFAVLFIIIYSLIRLLFNVLISLIFGRRMSLFSSRHKNPANLLSRLAGLAIGGIMGMTRCILVVAFLFIFVTLYPNQTFSHYVEDSPIYQDGAKMIIEPLSGNLVKEKLPVFTKAVEKELGGILQRKYDLIDRSIPADIEQAAEKIAGQAKGEEKKARLLYDWVGSRISYDNRKVDDYEQKGIWHEQTPQNTFDTKLGVCIDYARLYAVMARSQGLKVKVVTGLGYNGQGGYGPHAWNEVFLTDENKWIPLDPTWAKSGNWFNPPQFAQTHVKEQTL
ncbi:transglutaminase domain-containing protein [Paenibacillus antarcticus]|uniref:Cysteine protease n=1 Tax=Paenibacillus antarcticus TaxID=253703 RepID=A0A168R3T0_9BACL|nr:transglutaminase domain-containing protein [Paenibacillus antarcticus]OAB48552.1 cysteine protease [Paenibacillus antarcticus]